MKRLLFILLLSCSFTATLLVPEEYSTIQSAIDSSTDSDTILVSSGTYFENINVNKYLYFISNDGPESTFIDGGGNNGMASNVSFNINGFSFINCHEGINISWAGPLQVSNCIFNNNTTGLLSDGTNVISLSNSLFINNNVGYYETYYGNNCNIVNCTFDNENDIIFNPGYDTVAELNIYNSIFLGKITGMAEQEFNPVYLYYSLYNELNLGENVHDVIGNISGDPLFVDSFSANYNLLYNSPCIDSGDPISLSNDLDGSRNDMGFSGGKGIILEKSQIPFGFVSSENENIISININNNSNEDIEIETFESTNLEFNCISEFPVIIERGETSSIQFSFNPTTSGDVSAIISFDGYGFVGSADFNLTAYGIIFSGNKIQVPEVAPTIQAAVDISTNQDTIVVNDGIYYESVLVDKSLTFLGQNGADNTIIIGDDQFGFKIRHNHTTKVSGFTFQDTSWGLLLGRAPFVEISDCIFNNNHQGIASDLEKNLTISNSLFINNDIGYYEYYYGDDCLIKSCTFNNTDDIIFNPGYGTFAELHIFNSILNGGVTGLDGDGNNPVYLNYSLYDNANLGTNVHDVIGNVLGNPLFTDSDSDNYNLQSNSPCIDSGDPQDELDPDGTRADMGAYPFYQSYMNFALDSILLYDIDNSTDYEYTMFANSSVQNIGGIQFDIYDLPDYIDFDSIVSHLDIFDLVYGNDHEDGSYSVVMLNTNQIEFPSENPLEELPLITFNFNLNYTNSDFEFGEDVQIDLDSPLVGSFDAVPINASFSYGAISIGYQGDISQDGIINVYDLITGIWFILEENYPTDYEFWASDINSDGDINIYDLLILINIILGN